MAKSERNDYQVIRKSLPTECDEDIIRMSNITISKKGIKGILKIISDMLDDDSIYTAELVIKKRGKDYGLPNT